MSVEIDSSCRLAHTSYSRMCIISVVLFQSVLVESTDVYHTLLVYDTHPWSKVENLENVGHSLNLWTRLTIKSLLWDRQFNAFSPVLFVTLPTSFVFVNCASISALFQTQYLRFYILFYIPELAEGYTPLSSCLPIQLFIQYLAFIKISCVWINVVDTRMCIIHSSSPEEECMIHNREWI